MKVGVGRDVNNGVIIDSTASGVSHHTSTLALVAWHHGLLAYAPTPEGQRKKMPLYPQHKQGRIKTSVVLGLRMEAPRVWG